MSVNEENNNTGAVEESPPPQQQEQQRQTVAIGSKIHLFEHSEREKAERQEKELKKAVFARKLSKFSVDSDPETDARRNGGRRPSDVKQLAEKFQNMPDPEGERELRKRREAFERKRSGFLGQGETAAGGEGGGDSVDQGGSRLRQVKLLFEDRDAALALQEEEAERKRREEEELQRRKRDFDAKSSMFRRMSDCH